jgi:hypothetical protein
VTIRMLRCACLAIHSGYTVREEHYPVACQTAWGFRASALRLIGVPRIFM